LVNETSRRYGFPLIILFSVNDEVINSKPPAPLPRDPLREATKLDLEIESLKKKNRWETVAQIMPMIATLVATAGFFFTMFVFQSQRTDEQRKDRLGREIEQRTKLQNQIRSDVDEILRFTGEEKVTLSRVSFLLEDVKTVMESKVNETERVSDLFPAYKRSLSESLVVLIRDDCDFSKFPRDVGLANTVIEHWKDYSEYLKSELPKLDYILFKYSRALQTIRDENPGYLEGLYLSDDGYEVSGKHRKRANEQVLYAHFVDILDGFNLHLALLDNPSDEAKKIKKAQLKEFESSLCNPVIAKDFLGSEFTNEKCKTTGNGR